MRGCRFCELVYDDDQYRFCPYCGEELDDVDSLADLLSGDAE